MMQSRSVDKDHEAFPELAASMPLGSSNMTGQLCCLYVEKDLLASIDRGLLCIGPIPVWAYDGARMFEGDNDQR